MNSTESNSKDIWMPVNLEAVIDSMLQEDEERQKQIRKEYLERNRERIKQYNKEYYKETKAVCIKRATEYYQANKASINEKVVCEDCGRCFTFQNKKRHEKSHFHQTLTAIKAQIR